MDSANVNHSQISMLDEDNTQIETRTWLVMKKLCEEVPEAGFHFQSISPAFIAFSPYSYHPSVITDLAQSVG